MHAYQSLRFAVALRAGRLPVPVAARPAGRARPGAAAPARAAGGGHAQRSDHSCAQG